jgi:LytR cell envelope-related transcriptional attenuator
LDHPAPTPEASVRPWRTATLVASGIAAVELVLLVALGVIVIGRTWLHETQSTVERRAVAKVAAQKGDRSQRSPRPARPKPLGPPSLSRRETSVLVLNGNGRTGAAAAEATIVSRRGYVVAAVGNARRATYPHSLVMYRPGYRPEGARLARDLRIRTVSPLDGLKARELLGAHLAVIVGR